MRKSSELDSYYGETWIIPAKKDLKNLLEKNYIIGLREDSARWSNCDTEIINFIKKWRNIKIFVKKSYLKWKSAEKFNSEYLDLKDKFKNIIPNQSFIDFWNKVFAFCAPIAIKVDIFEIENREYLITLLKSNSRLLKQIRFFIKWFEDMVSQWKYIDLYWKENLIISDDNKLFYVDSFLVFHDSDIVRKWSIEKIELLKSIVWNINK